MEVSRRALWTSRILGGLAVSFLALDAAGKLLAPAPVVEGTARLGYPAEALPVIGVLELLCVTLYVLPRTSVLGALLMTGYLGGAVATHLRVGDPVLSHTLFPVYVAVLVWGALVARDPRLRELALARPASSVAARGASLEVQP